MTLLNLQAAQLQIIGSQSVYMLQQAGMSSGNHDDSTHSVSNLRPCMLHQSVASIYLYFCVFA
jgi:hypothetical protein